MQKMTREELVEFRKVVVEVCYDPSDPVAYDACVLRIIDQLLEAMG
jgi:hypothetical protein